MLGTEGLLLVTAEGLFSGSIQEPPLRLDTEGFLSDSAERVSSRARHRGPPFRLGRKGLLSVSEQMASSRAQLGGPPQSSSHTGPLSIGVPEVPVFLIVVPSEPSKAHKVSPMLWILQRAPQTNRGPHQAD